MSKKKQQVEQKSELTIEEIRQRKLELYLMAKHIAAELFPDQAKSLESELELVAGVYDRVICYNEDYEVNEAETYDAREDMVNAIALAKQAWPNFLPLGHFKATFEMFDLVVELDDGDDDGDGE